MSDFSFLSEPTFEKITTTYKELIPISNTSTYIEYQFPQGNYLAEAFVMIIKYEGRDLCLDDVCVSFGDLFTNMVPYQCGSPHPTLSKIPGEFIHAFTNLQQNQISKTYFEIPLLKLSSSIIAWEFHKGNSQQLFSMSLTFNKSAEFNQVIKQILIRKFKLDQTTLTDDQINLIIADSLKKFEFKLLYREIRMLHGQFNQGIAMDPVRPYVLDRFNAQIESDNKAAILIHDFGQRFDYEYVLIKVNAPDTVLTKFEITTNLLLNPFTYTLTKEAAEIYGETFCFGSDYYLININQFIDSHINSFFAYKFEKMTGATRLFDTTTFTPEEAEELLAQPDSNSMELLMKQTADLIKLRQNDLHLDKRSIGLDKSKLKLWIKLGFDKVVANGSVNVYCYK